MYKSVPIWLMSNMNINVNKHPTLNGIEVQIQRCIIKFFENGHKDNKDKEKEMEKRQKTLETDGKTT